MGKIEYIIMGKVPTEEDRVRALEPYRMLKKKATKVPVSTPAHLAAVVHPILWRKLQELVSHIIESSLRHSIVGIAPSLPFILYPGSGTILAQFLVLK